MDTNQLQQLATNAELNHWPPHLGVTAEAGKIEYLAQRLREVAEREAASGTEIDTLSGKLEDVQGELHESEMEVKRLEAKVIDLVTALSRAETLLADIAKLVERR